MNVGVAPVKRETACRKQAGASDRTHPRLLWPRAREAKVSCPDTPDCFRSIVTRGLARYITAIPTAVRRRVRIRGMRQEIDMPGRDKLAEELDWLDAELADTVD